jgi:hypothetical protein
MKISILLAALVLASTPSFAANRVLKAGDVWILDACTDVNSGDPSAVMKLNSVISKGKIVTSGVEIDPPYQVSAPAYSSAGNNEAGYSWCAAVTVTKQ